ncbi:MAG TPA: hypothetical protein VGG11_13770 [Xanthobacteraceae bacterium]|jgi:hypothetical protein
MNGPDLATFCEEINGGTSIGDTLLGQFINLAKGIIEQQRPWVILRSTDTSKTVQATNVSQWNVGIDLSGIARFNRFDDSDEGCAIKLFDGNQTFLKYKQVPFQRRLEHIQRPGTFTYDENAEQLYLNGNNPFAGTLYIDHIKDSEDIDISDQNSTWAFPSWSHALLGFYAVGIYKGGVDFDDINARMAPDNRAQSAAILAQLEKWDNEKVLQAQQGVDPYDRQQDGFRANAIHINE